jgi:biopolymer transport protein ExbD
MNFSTNLQPKRYLLWVMLVFSFSIYANGQKKKVNNKVVSPPSKTNKAKPSVKRVAIVEIDENLKLKIFSEIERNNSSDEPQIPDTVSEVAIIDFNEKIPLKLLGSGNIIIRANANLKYEKVVNLINKIRSQTKQNIKVEISNDLFAKIPKLPTKADLLRPLKPNPLTLVVKLDENRNITLNNEEMGTINDLTQLKSLLRKVFQERADNGTFREGTNEVETGIYIKAPLSVIFFDIVKIAEALKDSGSSQIGLQVDDLQP